MCPLILGVACYDAILSGYVTSCYLQHRHSRRSLPLPPGRCITLWIRRTARDSASQSLQTSVLGIVVSKGCRKPGVNDIEWRVQRGWDGAAVAVEVLELCAHIHLRFLRLPLLPVPGHHPHREVSAVAATPMMPARSPCRHT